MGFLKIEIRDKRREIKEGYGRDSERAMVSGCEIARDSDPMFIRRLCAKRP
jgi:hypothetical protein